MWKRFCGLRTHFNRVRKTKSGQGVKELTDREQWLAKRMTFIRKYSKPDKAIGIGDVSSYICIIFKGEMFRVKYPKSMNSWVAFKVKYT